MRLAVSFGDAKIYVFLPLPCRHTEADESSNYYLLLRFRFSALDSLHTTVYIEYCVTDASFFSFSPCRMVPGHTERQVRRLSEQLC